MGCKGDYKGELNKQGEAHGLGTFTCRRGIYRGLFVADKGNGLFKCTTSWGLIIGEMKESDWHGKQTRHKKQMFSNSIWTDGRLNSSS